MNINGIGENIFYRAKRNSLSFEEAAKEKWDCIQGMQNEVDYHRAALLNEAMHHYDCDPDDDQSMKVLESFIIDVLGELRGKRTKKFVRFALAFEKDDNKRNWLIFGGCGMVLLTRVPATREDRVIERANATLQRTGADTISHGTLRLILKDALTARQYSKLLLEHRRPSGNTSAARKLRTLISFLLRLQKETPAVAKAVNKNKAVKAILFPPSLQ